MTCGQLLAIKFYGNAREITMGRIAYQIPFELKTFNFRDMCEQFCSFVKEVDRWAQSVYTNAKH